MTIYNEISRNRKETWLLMVLFVILVAAAVQAMALLLGGGYEVGIIAFVLSILFVTFSFYGSTRLVLSFSRATEVKHDENPDLYRLLENLCIGAGMPMPKLYVIEENAPNAFATGRDPKHAVVVVTRGLLNKLDKMELEGVLAHELSHIRNMDIRLMTVIVVLIGLVVLLTDVALRLAFFGAVGGGRRGGGGVVVLLIALVALIVAPIVGQIMKLAISRRREYLADASGAFLTRYPEGLARALEKIAADPEPLHVANKATAHLYISNPLKDKRGFTSRLFATHPPIEDRIGRLRSM